MGIAAGFLKSVYFFFTEDGAIVVGAVIALIVAGGLALAKPFPWAEDVAGPLLFLLIALLLAASLWRVVHHSRKGSSG